MFQGEIQTFPLTDLIQWLAMTRRTGRLTITQGENGLELFFAAGEIAAASSSDIIGADSPEKARAVLISALSRRLGYFVFEECVLPDEIAAANLRLPAQAFLLDVMRQLDEEQEAPPLSDRSSKAAGTRPETFTVADELRLEIVDRLLKEDFRVPPMPQLAARVLELTSKDFALRELGNLILTDQAVAAQILRYANSALSGGERRADTLPAAIQRLGTDEVVNIVLAISLHAQHSGRDIFAEQKRRLRMHSTVTAFFARSVAARTRLDPNLGFLCGLLIDFGMSVLYSLVQDVLSQGHVPAQVVAEIIRDYHPRVGRVVGEQWQLPRAVVEAIAYHHCIEGASAESRYVAVSALADLLASLALSQTRAGLEQFISDFPPEQLSGQPAGQLIGLSAERASVVLRDLPRQLDQAQQFLAG